MSSYWDGISGTGMVLSHSEFTDMMAVYVQKNPSESELINNAFVNHSISNTPIVKSKYAGELVTSQYTTAEDIKEMITQVDVLDDDDNTDGVTMLTFYRKDGRMNIREYKHDGTIEATVDCFYPVWEDPENTCYVCWSDKTMTSPMAFIEKPYANYDEFVQEFKDKFERYLPSDFDWNAHLGFISYALYG